MIRCKVCGRLMKKCEEEIGPTCLRRIKNRRVYHRYRSSTPEQDLFEEEQDGQGQDETADGCSEEQETAKLAVSTSITSTTASR